MVKWWILRLSEEDMDLVSIIVPVYNVEKYLPKCLDSIISQTYKNIEIILVDDGSTDNSGRICDEYTAFDKRISVLHKRNAGVVEARIDGFRNSNGTFIVFVDGDDYIALDCIEKMMRIQREYDVALVCSQYFDVENGIEKTTPIRPEVGYYNRTRIIDLLKSNFLFDEKTQIAGMSPFLCTKLIKREFIEDILITGRGLFYGEDQVGIFKLLSNISNMYVMQEALYYYVKREGQATQKYDVRLWDNFNLYIEIFEKMDIEKYLVRQLSLRSFVMLRSLVFKEFRYSNEYLSSARFLTSKCNGLLYRRAFSFKHKFKGIDRIKYLLLKYIMFTLYGCFHYLRNNEK